MMSTVNVKVGKCCFWITNITGVHWNYLLKSSYHKQCVPTVWILRQGYFLGIIIFKIYNPQYQSIKDYVFASAINDN